MYRNPTFNTRVKILCVCHMGMSRSVVLSYILKTYQGLDVLTCGVLHNSSETLQMLYAWAEKIFVLEQKIKDSIPDLFHEKIWVLDVGHDRWLNPLHPELQAMLMEGVTHFIRVAEEPNHANI